MHIKRSKKKKKDITQKEKKMFWKKVDKPYTILYPGTLKYIYYRSVSTSYVLLP